MYSAVTLLSKPLPFLIAALCAGCSYNERPASGSASVYVADLKQWNVAAAPGRGYWIDITSVNDSNVCTPSRCPVKITVNPGHTEIGVLCSVLIGNIKLPKQTATYHGNFVAGHEYRIEPASVVPQCRIQVRDVTREKQ